MLNLSVLIYLLWLQVFFFLRRYGFEQANTSDSAKKTHRNSHMKCLTVTGTKHLDFSIFSPLFYRNRFVSMILRNTDLA